MWIVFFMSKGIKQTHTMKKLFATGLLLTIGLTAAQAQVKDWAIGFQVGGPTGIHLRKYGDRNAFDLTFGTYGNLFGKNQNYRKGEYRAPGMMLNASYLWYVPLANDRFSAYAGLGAQINSRRYYPDVESKVNIKTISVGPTAKGGFEYFLRNRPLSLFAEATVYAELLPAVFYIDPSLSAGIRTNF
jgi:hypothetical protein